MFAEIFGRHLLIAKIISPKADDFNRNRLFHHNFFVYEDSSPHLSCSGRRFSKNVQEKMLAFIIVKLVNTW